jgi:hypothetical protein
MSQQPSHRRPTPSRFHGARSLGAGMVDAVRPGLTRLGVGYALLGAAIVALLSR